MVAQLADESFAVREQAGAALLTLARTEPAEVGRALAAAFRKSPEPEIRVRSKSLLMKMFTGSIGYVGVYYAPDNELGIDGRIHQGVRIGQVAPGSPAEAAGLIPGDFISALNGHPLNPAEPDTDFAQRVQMLGIGQPATLTLLRNRREIEAKVTLAERPLPLAIQQAESLFQARLEELEHPSLKKPLAPAP